MKKTYFACFVAGLAVAFVFTFSPRASAVSIVTFSNPSPITIPNVGIATPYPTAINVNGIIGLVADVNVILTGVSHTFPEDIGALLAGPGGQRVVLMNGAGGFTPIVNVSITFDDQAASSLPSSGGIPSGSYRPTNFFPSDVFAPPAPGAPYSSLLSVFNGTNPNGVWSLFIQDFSPGDGGSVSGGWSLQITAVPEPSTLLLFGVGLLGIVAWIRRKQLY